MAKVISKMTAKVNVEGLAGFIGLMRKRPGDVTPEELKKAVGGQEAELTARERQFAELVKGVQRFLLSGPADELSLIHI